MDALVHLLKHQTTITERWQQMLMEQSESTKYLQRINVDNAKLVRDQVEATQRLVEMERQNSKPSSPREPDHSPRRNSSKSRHSRSEREHDESRSASEDEEPPEYKTRDRRHSRSSAGYREETMTAMQREMRELRALMEQSSQPVSNSKSEVNALRELITSLQVELAQKSASNSEDAGVSAIKNEILGLRSQIAASGENRMTQAEQEKQRLKEELERLRAEASSKEIMHGQATMHQELQMQQQQQQMQLQLQLQQQEIENARQRMLQEKAELEHQMHQQKLDVEAEARARAAEMETKARQMEVQAQAEVQRLKQEAEMQMRAKQSEFEAQKEAIRLRAEAADKAKQEAEMRAQQALMEADTRMKQAELEAQRMSQQAAHESEMRAKQAEEEAHKAARKAQEEAEARARKAEARAMEMQLKAERDAEVAAARAAAAEAAVAAQVEAARKAEEEAHQAAVKAQYDAEAAAAKAQQEAEAAAALAAAAATKAAEEAAQQAAEAAAAKAKQEGDVAAAQAAMEAAKRAEEAAQQAVMLAQQEAEMKAKQGAEAARAKAKQEADAAAMVAAADPPPASPPAPAAAAGAPLAEDLPPPKPPPPPPSDEMPGASCPGLNNLASQMGVNAPSGKAWLSMFCDTIEQLPHAVAITDMQMPGLPIAFANSAMVALTGYAKDAIEGRNCRFLQGKKSEAAAVRAMVSAIRGTKPTTVKITNYRKDGKTFVNVLSLIPVKDNTGQYRYNVGVLSDAKNQSSEKEALEKLRGAIPVEFDTKLQPKRFDESLTQVDDEAQKKQWKQSMVKFTRLLWSADWETSLLQVVRNEGGMHFFGKWLAANAPGDATQLEMWVYVQQVAAMPPDQQGAAAMQLCQQLLGSVPGSPEEALAGLQSMSGQAISVLSRESFPRFVQSKACLPLVEQLIGAQAEELKKADDIIWNQYTVPPDCAGWIHSFASVACTMPACIVISDMAMPGNPMFFVNDEFCRVTGYERTEAQGRNCRFLQGPRTEPQSVAVIQDTLRRGVDCHVKITNYRKSGELFENLLTMRPVHDSNGVYRFCIGVQFEVTRDTNLKSRLAKLDKLIKLLPATLEVASKAAVGVAHKREETEEETQTALDQKLASALEGNTVAPDNQVLQDSDYFAENHKEMLQHIGVVPKDAEQATGAGGGAVPAAPPVAAAAAPAAPAVIAGAPLAEDLPPPKPPPPPPSDEMPGASCPGLNNLASQMGVNAPSGKAWLSMFCDTIEQLPHAVAITDMQMPGLPIAFANSAMVALTGYAKDAIEGRNCRFLQGKKSEAAAVRAMVSAIRGTKPTTVKITNYRKDGKTFVNVLSLIPVKDNTGQYRYNVGVLSDAKNQSSEKEALEKLRGAIPVEFDTKLQPKRFDESLTQVDDEAQKKQWKQSMVKFTRLLWSADWETSLLQVVRNEGGMHFFGKWLAANAPGDATQLEMWVYVQQVAAMPPDQQGAAAMQLCQQLLGSVPGSPEEALAGLQSMSGQAISVLSRESFPRFVQSKACLPLVEQLIGAQAEELKKADDIIWNQYTVPPDCAGWIHSFASVACTMPACIVISDMAMPGNPMFFVNDEFCRVTGYERTEAQGRNCRFLQGPRTEPQSVAVIQDTLRRGVDCHVKITNYRKSGELFENLLTMRPVHDSNGVYRFCIGVQFEVTRDTNLKSRLAKLDKLIKLLPATLEVASKAAVGVAHKREETEEETQTALDQKLASALEGNTVAPDNQVLQDSDYFAENHKEMLQHIGAVEKEPDYVPSAL